MFDHFVDEYQEQSSSAKRSCYMKGSDKLIWQAMYQQPRNNSSGERIMHRQQDLVILFCEIGNGFFGDLIHLATII